MVNEPKTVAEMLDAAETAEEIAARDTYAERAYHAQRSSR